MEKILKDSNILDKDYIKDIIKASKLKQSSTKYVVVCGGTISGIGKGTCITSLGVLFQSLGLKVTCVKIDPYFNVDAGTMSPYEHGEVFVLDDGGEVDLDLGNYERVMRLSLTRQHNLTSGKVFKNVIEAERRGEYLGKTVQMIPHVTDKILQMIEDAVEITTGDHVDICLIEIGGTVGDLESNIFFEAIRQLIYQIGKDKVSIILLGFVPQPHEAEFKTKPTQHAVKDLKSMGLFPDYIICRSKDPLPDSIKNKIAFYANLSTENIISVYDVDIYYDVPLLLAYQNLPIKVLKSVSLPIRNYNVEKWVRLSEHIRRLKKDKENIVNIVICGKYATWSDTYYSVLKSLQDSGYSMSINLNDMWLDTTILDERLDTDPEQDQEELRTKRDKFWETLKSANGIIVPGGFGHRGVKGMLEVIRYARENKVPYLGICLGMQLAVVEFCQNVLGLKDADSKEFNEKTYHDVITTMDDTSYVQLGGTLRLGSKTTVIKDKDTLAYKVYGQHEIKERHRHRYEVNPKFIELIEKNGMIFSGRDPDSERMVILELKDHPFFFASQFHPEFKTNPFIPPPSFYMFLLHAGKAEEKIKNYVETRQTIGDYIDSIGGDEIKSVDNKYQMLIDVILRNGKSINEVLEEEDSGNDPKY